MKYKRARPVHDLAAHFELSPGLSSGARCSGGPPPRKRPNCRKPTWKSLNTRRNLRNIFHRMQLTEQDMRTLRGMVVRLVEGPRAGAAPEKMPPGGEAATPPDSRASLAPYEK